MNTFLPFPSYELSAQCLDNRRLGKQRVETYQIYQALSGAYGNRGAWTNHPATNMWRGYEAALLLYGQVICEEWRKRGFADKMLDTFVAFSQLPKHKEIITPWWFGFQPLHLSHRSNLLRKDPAWYSVEFKHFLPPNDLPYLWPYSEDDYQFKVGATGQFYHGPMPVW